MRVFIVYPPITMQERYSSALGHAGGNQIPLGIFHLAAYLRQVGHAVAVVDAEARDLTAEGVLDLARAFAPDVIGISSTTIAFHRSLDLAGEFKRAWPNLPIVLGGPHVSAIPREVLAEPVFDYGVVGEGEQTLTELLAALADGRSPAGIRGLAWRRDGAVVIEAPRPLIENLDDLPLPAYDLIPDMAVYNPPPCNYKRLPVINIVSSRGCPNQCTFCDRAVYGRSLRQRGAASLAAEIEHVLRVHHVREIAFVDDTFTIQPQRIRELFTILDAHGVAFPWTCMSRINTVDEDTLRWMRDHGCWHISFGIESGSEEILRIVRKNINLAQARQVIGWCAKLGIRTKGFFIVGHPGDTPETIDETIRFALDLPLDDVVVPINTPSPGTEQYRDSDRYGTIVERDWAKYNCWNPVFIPHGLTRELLLAKHREFYRRFYLRPRILWRYFLSFFTPAGPRRLLALMRSLPFLFTSR